MKKRLGISLLVAVLMSVMAVGAVAAQGEPPIAGPDNPTDLLAVLGWLAAGGAGPAIAFALNKLPWFRAIENDNVKLGIVVTCVVIVPLTAKVAIDLVPPHIWPLVQPYWATAVGALLLGWPASQITFETFIKPKKG